MRTAVCSGSFDPITLGHLDVIVRAAACFDKVWVCVSPNSDKRISMFTTEQKLRLVRAAVAELSNVEAAPLEGLLAPWAAARGACAIVRGVRNGTDLDAEMQMARINRDLCPGLETLFLPASAPYQHLSSSLAREMIRYGQPLDRYLPGAVAPLVQDILDQEGD